MTTRAQFIHAVETSSWDLLDLLLEEDPGPMNDNALFGDGWGDWWGLLLQCVYDDAVTGVRVLLAHGARRDLVRWGDAGYPPHTPLEAAREGNRNPEIIALLEDPSTPMYQRKSVVKRPAMDQSRDEKINRQGEIRDATGLVFPVY